MAASFQYRRSQERMKQVDEDIAKFLAMRRQEKEEKNDIIFDFSAEYDDSTASNPDSSVVLSDAASTLIAHNTLVDNLLDAPDNAKSDFNWLLSPPASPTPKAKMQVPEAAIQIELSNGATRDLKSVVPENTPEENSSMNDASEKPVTSISTSSLAPGNRRPSSSGSRRSVTSRFPTPSRLSHPAAPSKPSRSSTPSARGTVPSSKPVAPSTSSLIPSRTSARSSTPPARSASLSSSKTMPRSATPTRKTLTPSAACSLSAPSSRPSSASSISAPSIFPSTANKTGPTVLTSSRKSRGVSPPVRSRPKITSEVPVSSSNIAPSVRVSAPKRASSVSKVKPTASGAKPLSSNTTSGRSRQKSCSPLRERANVGSFSSLNSSLSQSRGFFDGIDDRVNPALVGTKMVERVVNMRKLAPPKEDNRPLDDNSARKSSLDKSGFGRSLSKKSLDMAIRHMDIRRTSPVNLNTKRVPAASAYSLRSGSREMRSVDALHAYLSQSSSMDSGPRSDNTSGELDRCGIEEVSSISFEI